MAKLGDRVELVYTSDPYTNLKRGDRGEVTFIDGLGTVSIKWDNGSTLGMIPGEDVFKVVEARA